jgi:two-component system sensor histidine kinase YesM
MFGRLKAMARQRMFWIERLTLQKRLVITYVLIILLPSILISLYIFNEFYGNYIKDIEKKNENSLEIEQVHIKNNIETMKRTDQLTVPYGKEVLDYLSRPTEPSSSELIDLNENSIKQILRRLYYNPSIKHIRIFKSSPLIYEYWPVVFDEKRIISESWYEPVKEAAGQDYWVYSREDREPNARKEDSPIMQPKISLIRELKYPYHVGFIQIDMMLDNFFPNTFSPLQEGQSQMLIMDRDRQFYRYPNNPFMDNSGLTEAVIREQFALQSKTGDATGNFRFSSGGIPFLCVYTHIQALDTYMLNIVSLESVYKDINKTRNQIIIANIILIVILSLATNKLNSIILKKLHVLTDSMKKVRQGDFLFDISIRGGGEVGELAYHFRKMLKKINELIADAVHKQAANKEAELTTLRNQIDSHFLYNTLENIKMMAEINNQMEISDALTSLGGMLRYNTKWTSDFVRLRDELTHINNYIAIMNVRFNDQIKLVTDIPDCYLSQEILKMSLQPVVENAIKYGLKDKPLTIMIRAGVIAETMAIEITNDGSALSKEQTIEINRRIELEEERSGDVTTKNNPGESAVQGSGIGLINVQRRIRMNYGKEYGLYLEVEEGLRTRIVIRIPYLILNGRGS